MAFIRISEAVGGHRIDNAAVTGQKEQNSQLMTIPQITKPLLQLHNLIMNI